MAGWALPDSFGSELLGGTGLGFESSSETVTGYVLSRDAWGRGYATEALSAMIDVAMRIGVHRLSAQCHARHTTSQRVLEKCGSGEMPPVKSSSRISRSPDSRPSVTFG